MAIGVSGKSRIPPHPSPPPISTSALVGLPGAFEVVIRHLPPCACGLRFGLASTSFQFGAGRLRAGKFATIKLAYAKAAEHLGDEALRGGVEWGPGNGSITVLLAEHSGHHQDADNAVLSPAESQAK